MSLKNNSKKIEEIAVTALENVINCSEHLYADISSNDKTISVDGQISYYIDGTASVDTLLGIGFLQIKGKVATSKELKNKKIKYPVRIGDIKNFLHYGGAIYFVVCINSVVAVTPKTRIYYAVLLPYDLQNILRTYGSQKSRTLEFEVLPDCIDKVDLLIRTFLEDKKLQSNTVGDYNNSGLDTEYALFLPSIKGFPYLDSNSKYVYKILEGNVCTPIAKIKIESMQVNSVPIVTCVDGTVVFQHGKAVFKEGNQLKQININPGLSIVFDDVNIDRGTLNVSRQCTFSDMQKNLDFMLRYCNGAYVEVGKIFSFECLENKSICLTVEDDLQFIKRIVKLFKYMNIQDCYCVDSFSDKELHILHELYDYIILGKRYKVDKNGIGRCTVGPLIVLVASIKDDNGDMGRIYDAFKMPVGNVEMAVSDKSERFKSSVFTQLSIDDYSQLSNIDYCVVVKSICSVTYSKMYEEVVTNSLLRILVAYDKTKNNNLLDLADKISAYIFSHNTHDMAFINRMQVIKRRREFSISEIEEMLDRKNKLGKLNNDNIMLLAAINSLLDNSREVDFCLKNMSQKQRNTYMAYPISIFLGK